MWRRLLTVKRLLLFLAISGVFLVFGKISQQLLEGNEVTGGGLSASQSQMKRSMDVVLAHLIPTTHITTTSHQAREEESVKTLKLSSHSLPCTPLEPNIMLFIRIPKSASTSFVELFHSLKTRNSFEVLFNPSGAYNWKEVEIRREVRKIKNKATHKKLVYARHFYYINFASYGMSSYAYVAVMREPMARFMSAYLYYHFSSKPHIKRMLRPQDVNENIVECVAKKHNGCEHNLQTKYFCGHEALCSFNVTFALQVAKRNIREKFAVVGIMEDLETTMEVLSKLLPGYFGPVDQQGNLPVTNKNDKPAKTLTLEEKEAVQRANTADMELYAYARELLQAKVTACRQADE